MFSEFARNAASRGDGKKINVPGRLEFTVSGQDVSLVSGLRRAIMTDVQTAAFRFDAVNPEEQDVRVTLNTGSLHNEIIGERVGLIPLHLSKSQLVGFKPASWRFEIDAENDGARPLDVTTERFAAVPLDDGDAAISASRVFPPDPISGKHPLLTVLMPGQRLALQATASFGSGSRHARYSPAAAVAMFPVADEAAVERERKKREDKASFDALDAKRMVATDEKGRPKAYRFSLESQCGMSPEDIVESAYEALAGRFRALSAATDGAETVADVEAQTGSPPDIHGLELTGEDHTAGAIIQERLLLATDYAGYYVPHLMEQSIVVRLRVPSGATARGMLKEACESAADLCENALAEWQKCSKK